MLFFALFRKLCIWICNWIFMLNFHESGIIYLLWAIETKWVPFLFIQIWCFFSLRSLSIQLFAILNISSVRWMHVNLILTLYSIALKFVRFISYILMGYSSRIGLFILIERSVVFIGRNPLLLIFFVHLFVISLLS